MTCKDRRLTRNFGSSTSIPDLAYLISHSIGKAPHRRGKRRSEKKKKKKKVVEVNAGVVKKRK